MVELVLAVKHSFKLMLSLVLQNCRNFILLCCVCARLCVCVCVCVCVCGGGGGGGGE